MSRQAVLASAVALAGVTGCHSNQQPGIVAVNNSGADPADANMANVAEDGGALSANAAYEPAQGSTRLLSHSGGRVLDTRMANVNQQQTQGTAASDPGYATQGRGGADQSYSSNQGPEDWTPGEQDAYNQVTEEADAPPPALPDYEQPPAPAPNYLWTPGYWGYAPAGYYWIPGAWVAAPYYGALWTPGYWGVWHHHYGYHPGYWGTHIGFYGGVSYGFGYYGTGYHGGYWRGNDFYYNQAVNRVNVLNVRNVYNRSVVVNNITVNNTIVNARNPTFNRTSYNGGRGGIQARPQAAESAAFRGPRTPPMSTQLQNQRAAAENRQQFFSQNRGRPVIAAAPRPFAADRNVAPPPARTGLEPGVRIQAPAPQQQEDRGQGRADVSPPARPGTEQQRSQPVLAQQRVSDLRRQGQTPAATQQDRDQQPRGQQQQRLQQDTQAEAQRRVAQEHSVQAQQPGTQPTQRPLQAARQQEQQRATVRQQRIAPQGVPQRGSQPNQRALQQQGIADQQLRTHEDQARSQQSQQQQRPVPVQSQRPGPQEQHVQQQTQRVAPQPRVQSSPHEGGHPAPQGHPQSNEGERRH